MLVLSGDLLIQRPSCPTLNHLGERDQVLKKVNKYNNETKYFRMMTWVFLWAIFGQISLMIKCWIFHVSWVLYCTEEAFFYCSASPYFILLLSVLFIRIVHDHMISLQFLYSVYREITEKIQFYSFIIFYVQNQRSISTTQGWMDVKKSFFCFLFWRLFGPTFTKLKLKLYYLPKVIKFADEKLNFQQDKVTLQVPVQYCQIKKLKVLLSDDFVNR